MTATGHAVIGTVIAAKIANPLLAIPIALASHVIADITPHWDAGTNGKKKSHKQMFYESAADVLFGFFIAYLIIVLFFPTTNILYAIFIILISQGLDWLSAPYSIFNMKSIPFSWFYKFQSKINTRLDKPWGIILQVAILLLVVFAGKSL